MGHVSALPAGARHEGVALGQPCLHALSYVPTELLTVDGSNVRSSGALEALGQPVQGPALGFAVFHDERIARRVPFSMPRVLLGGAPFAERPPITPPLSLGPLGFGVASRASGYDAFGPRQERAPAE